MKTEWNLKLLYKSESDPKIEEDLRNMERISASFQKKYSKSDFTSTPEKLSKALRDYEKVLETINSWKPWRYFYNRTVLNSADKVAGAKSTQINECLSNITNKISFFSISIAKIPVSKQKLFLKSKTLSRYRRVIEKEFAKSSHYLSVPEEQLASLMRIPAHNMWIAGHSRVLSQKTIEFKGEAIPLAKASSIVSDLPKKERQIIRNKINEVYMAMSDFTESEINAVFTDKKIMDERRGYAKPYSETVLEYENTDDEVETLVKLVTKNFAISHRFYKLHAKLLNEKKITNVDKSVKIGEIKRKFDFATSVELVKSAFSKFGKEYSEYLDRYISNGQIDVYPSKGKRGGAFCSYRGDDATLVFLNHTDDLRSIETLAHEMGHAIHTDMSYKAQPVHYKEYTISVAEVASTFFEQILLDELEKSLNKKEKIILLHTKLMSNIATVFRQIACFNFELELHEKIRKIGGQSKGEIADIMAKHMRAYLGPAVEMSHADGYVYVGWPHIRNFFYVYSYAYGQIISKALFENWKNDPAYKEKIETFLMAGNSMSPRELWKSIGIDTTNPKFFETGLKAIEEDIKKLEKLTGK